MVGLHIQLCLGIFACVLGVVMLLKVRNDKGLPLRVGFFSRVLRGLLIVKQA